MTVEKFVEAGSIDPMYYDARYFMAPDGKPGEDVYTDLREAISRIGMIAISRVVISQRERTIALRLFGEGLPEQRDRPDGGPEEKPWTGASGHPNGRRKTREGKGKGEGTGAESARSQAADQGRQGGRQNHRTGSSGEAGGGSFKTGSQAGLSCSIG